MMVMRIQVKRDGTEQFMVIGQSRFSCSITSENGSITTLVEK